MMHLVLLHLLLHLVSLHPDPGPRLAERTTLGKDHLYRHSLMPKLVRRHRARRLVAALSTTSIGEQQRISLKKQHVEKVTLEWKTLLSLSTCCDIQGRKINFTNWKTLAGRPVSRITRVTLACVS